MATVPANLKSQAQPAQAGPSGRVFRSHLPDHISFATAKGEFFSFYKGLLRTESEDVITALARAIKQGEVEEVDSKTEVQERPSRIAQRAAEQRAADTGTIMGPADLLARAAAIASTANTPQAAQSTSVAS